MLLQGYAEVLSGFSEASASTQDSAAPGQRIRVSLDASSSPEVPFVLSFSFTFSPGPYQAAHHLLCTQVPLACCSEEICAAAA